MNDIKNRLGVDGATASPADLLAQAQAENTRLKETLKRYELKLRESEGTFRDLTEKSLVGVYLIEGDLFRYVNPRFCEIVGYDIHEIVDRLGPRDLTHPDDWDRSRENIRKRFAGEVDAVNYELRCVKKNGDVIDAELYGSRTLYHGQAAIVGTILDISDRKRAERELRSSERKYRDILDNMIDTYYRTDTEGRLLIASASCRSLLGWTADELIGRRLGDFYAEADGRLKFLAELAANGGSISRYEAPMRRKDGSVVWVATSAHYYRDDEGNILGVEGVTRDITAIRSSREELRANVGRLERFRRLGSLAFTGLAIHEDGVVIDSNLSLEGLTGFNRHELLGSDVLRLIAPRFREKVRDNLIRSYEKPYLVAGVRKSGEEYALELVAKRIEDRGEVIQALEFRDVEERVQAETEREQLQRQLQQAQKMEAIGQLAGGVAHDFNNILAIILGYSKLALRSSMSNQESEQTDYLRQVIKAGERGRDLVAQMLAFSRGSESIPRDIELKLVIGEVLKMLRATLPTTIEIEQDYAEDLPLVHIDPLQLHQVIANLCINARDAMPDGGRLTIKVGKVTHDHKTCASCHGTVDGDFVEVRVSDSGTGIEHKLLEQVFSPFFSTKEIGKGTGMGLSVVHGIVHAHNGHILLDSHLGEGCTFHLLFPASVVTSGSGVVRGGEAGALDLALSNQRRGNILVVDDEQGLTRFLNLLLTKYGYNVFTVNHPEDALKRMQNNADEIDLVITDQTMPGFTGMELAAKLTALHPGLPILLYTGHLEGFDGDEPKAAGIGAVLTKPIESKILLETIERLLAAARGAEKRTKAG